MEPFTVSRRPTKRKYGSSCGRGAACNPHRPGPRKCGRWANGARKPRSACIRAVKRLGETNWSTPTRPFEQLCVTPKLGGRLAVIVHGRHWGLSQGRWLNFQSTRTADQPVLVGGVDLNGAAQAGLQGQDVRAQQRDVVIVHHIVGLAVEHLADVPRICGPDCCTTKGESSRIRCASHGRPRWGGGESEFGFLGME